MIYRNDEKRSIEVSSKANLSASTTTIQSVELEDRSCLVRTNDEPELAWRPGFRARFPWMSFASLLIVIACAVGAVLVLWRANHQSAKIWYKHARPNVMLTILSSVSNLFITAAVGQAVAIAWWRRALKGTTIQDLHHSWSFSTSFTSILTQYRYFNVLALAALMTKVTFIDGILFQQSLFSYTRLGSAYEQTFFGFATTDFPQTAAVYTTDNKTVQNTFGLFDVLLPWRYSANEIYNPQGFQQCSGICAASITTIGFTVRCDTVTEDVDYVLESYDNALNTTVWPVFGIKFETCSSTPSTNYSYIQAEVTTYKRRQSAVGDRRLSCPATLQRRTCQLRPALIDYPILMQKVNTSTATRNEVVQTKVMLGELSDDGVYSSEGRDWHDGMTQLNGFNLNKTLDFQDTRGDGDPTHSRLAGITQVMNESFASSGYIHGPDGLWESSSQGQYASIEYGRNDTLPNPGDQCPPGWGDPMGDIMFSLNTLMFILSDMNGEINATIVGSEMQDEVYYSWKWEYSVGAVISTTFCILCILPAYWGFWELGRKVTLGPFEIAHAFEAPVLAHVHLGSGEVDDVLQAAGKETVRYVARGDGMVGNCLIFEVQGRP